MQKLVKNKLIYFLKIIITITILFFIFRKIDFYQLINTFKNIGITTVILILLIAVIKIFIEYKNWGHYLKINPDYIPQNSEIFRSLMIGHALRFLIPGGHGVVGKMYFVNNRKMLTFMSVGVEKFFQIWINLLYASFAAIFYFRHTQLFWMICLFILILSLPLLIYLIKHLHKKQSVEIYFKKYLKIVPRICSMQGIYMALTIFQYFLLLNNFLRFHIFSAIISIPLILFANVIPITYAGLGLREQFAMEVLSKYHISSEIAITASLTIFILNSVLPALLGLYFIIRKSKIKT